jgi:hypothetical protein
MQSSIKLSSSFLVAACYSLFLVVKTVYAADMDAHLNMAKRSLAEIEITISKIQPGDVSLYNNLSGKLTKTAELLKKTESKAHPDYVTTIQKWSLLQQSMVNIAQQWQQTKTSQSTASTDHSAESHSLNQTKQVNTESVSPNNVNVEAILAKYQRQNRPPLSAKPSPDEAQQWSSAMLALQTTELQKDQAILKNSAAASADIQRVSKWIGGNFQQQINQDIQKQIANNEGQIQTAAQLAQQIANIGDNKMRAFNFANGENGDRNSAILANGLRASAVGKVYDENFPQLANSQRQALLVAIVMAQQTFKTLQEESVATATELAKLPKKQKKPKVHFLKGLEQALWLRGSVFASIDKKGNVFIGSREVGDIETNGKIWVRGNQLGSIETNGKVWFRGNHVGTLEENGKVWRDGNQIGLIETNGRVWIDGNSNGEITPYENEWKRAAILYYFRDFFND